LASVHRTVVTTHEHSSPIARLGRLDSRLAASADGTNVGGFVVDARD
jgi:hypothetical protein